MQRICYNIGISNHNYFVHAIVSIPIFFLIIERNVGFLIQFNVHSIHFSVPVTISESEVLIIFDGSVSDPTRLFNITLYGNANVNIVARNGLWSLSENYLEPRIFKKVRR